MDEPTAALSGVEVDRLFAVARSLRDEGRALVFISHRFDEVFALCDTVTVMRDGDYVSTQPIADTTVDQLVAADGRPRGRRPVPEDARPRSATWCSRSRAWSPPGRSTTSASRSGPARSSAWPGLVGAGRSEIARAVFGVDAYDAGSVRAARQGRSAAQPARRDQGRHGLRPRGPSQAGAGHRGLGRPQRRRRSSAAASTRFGLLTTRAENRASGPWAAKLEVKTSALDMAAATMSGGNQQKVVIAKWLATQPRLLIIDEPTRGIDVGTKAEVHRLLSDLAGEGLAVLMISSELPEVLGMADRVLVVCEGQITADIARADATPENVMHAATARSAPRKRRRTLSQESPHERAPRRAQRRVTRPVGWSADCSARARSPSSACCSR